MGTSSTQRGVPTEPTPAENHDLRGCFACGRDNTQGLRLRFEWRDGAAVAETTCRRAHVSWRGIIHGGLLITMMDEAMGWAVAERGWTGLTAHLDARLLIPVPPDQPLVVRGWVMRWRRRIAQAAAEVRTPGGTHVGEAKALVLLTHVLPEVALHP